MSLFKKRETLTQNIAYMGIMAAINVIATILMNYVLPVLFIPFMLILPLTSTVVTLFCKKRYFVFYAIATVGICFLVTINNISDTLFYILPSIISGFLFGIFIIYRLPATGAIFAAALANVAITYLSIPIINLIYGQNIIHTIASLFHLQDFIYLDFVVPTFILLMSIIQETLTFAIIDNEIPKLGFEEETIEIPFLNQIIGLLGSFLSLICFLVKPSLFSNFALFFTIFALFFAVYEVCIFGFEKNFKMLIATGVITLVFILVFAILYQYVPTPYQFILFNIYFDLILLASLVNTSLTKRKKNVE